MNISSSILLAVALREVQIRALDIIYNKLDAAFPLPNHNQEVVSPIIIDRWRVQVRENFERILPPNTWRRRIIMISIPVYGIQAYGYVRCDIPRMDINSRPLLGLVIAIYIVALSTVFDYETTEMSLAGRRMFQILSIIGAIVRIYGIN